ncbi:MAG: hypothetical protein ABUL60_10420 [Myxococcales bacterium]
MTLARCFTLPRLVHSPSLACLMVSLATWACNAPPVSESRAQTNAATPAVSTQSSVARVEAKPIAAAPTPAASAKTAPSSASRALASVATSTTPSTTTPHRALESSVRVKRFVVATGIQDREPLISNDALPGDGTAIYAFAELANPVGESENVRITFERKGGSERVGDVTLPIPPSTPRHRTWAFTRFIRTAGVWEAVLWSENGAELSRTSFEVKAS